MTPLIGYAVGELGLSLSDVLRMTLPEFRATVRCRHDRMERESRRQWEVARTAACIVIQPWARKDLDPKKVLPLPWDAEESRTGRHPVRRKRSRAEEQARFAYYREHGVWPSTDHKDIL